MDQYLNDEIILQISHQVICRQNKNGSLSIIHLDEQDDFFEIHGKACHFFELINGKRTLAQIKKEFSQKYPEENFNAMIQDFIKELVSARIVHTI